MAQAPGLQHVGEYHIATAAAVRQGAAVAGRPWSAEGAEPCARSAERTQRRPAAMRGKHRSSSAPPGSRPVSRKGTATELDVAAFASLENRPRPPPSTQRRAREEMPKRPGPRFLRSRNPTLPQERSSAGKSIRAKALAQPSPCFLWVVAASCFGGTAGKVESRAGASPAGRSDTM